MLERIHQGLALSLPVLLLLTAVLGADMVSDAQAADEVGLLNEGGLFVAKAVVIHKESSITFRKTDPKERFGALRIVFLPPEMKKPDALKGWFIQWEKQPGFFGELWPLENHRRLDPHTRIFSGSWQNSTAFVIIDKANPQPFRGRRWHETIEVHLNGRKLVQRPLSNPASASTGRVAVQEPPSELRTNSDEAPKDRPQFQPAAAPVKVDAPLVPAQVTDRVSLTALEAKYERLLTRVDELEGALSSGRRWLYFGTILAVTLSVLFSGVALLAVYLARHRRTPHRIVSAPRLEKMRVR
ncbi:MAG: hypothetical protein V2B18_03700 [Pseudomonadota bacterium]